MSYVERNLLPTERLVYTTRLHWIEYVAQALWWSIAGLMISLPFANSLETPGLLSVMVLSALIGMFIAWIKVITSEFAVTNNRVLVKVGLIRRHPLEIVLRQVEGIGVDQGILGRIFGFGTIIVSGTGATKEPFIRINKPLEFRRQAQVLAGA